MIKLIVTDMDGCLLDSKSNFPSNFKEAYELMKANNVIFAVASGRSIDGLYRAFGEQAGEMTFVSDNGARICHKGELLAEEILTYEDYAPFLEEMRSHKDLLSIACGEERKWVENEKAVSERARAELLKFYPGWYESSFENVPEKVIRFAMLYFDDIEKNIYPYFKKYDNERVRVQVTSYEWIDIYPKNVSKGRGVKAIQERFGILPSETMVFGDYLNDISMADHAEHSYAPANAHPDVIERFTDKIRSNDECGVTDTIINILKNS